MTKYYEKRTSVGGSTLEGISPRRGKVRLCFLQKDGSKGVILNLSDVYYLPHSLCNLVSLGCLNSHDIYHDNKIKKLYYVKTRKILAYAERWNNSYLLRPLNLLDSATLLRKLDNKDTYQYPNAFVHLTSKSKFALTSWHKRLGHLNFPAIEKYLQQLNVKFVDDSEGHVCDSCQRSKATKVYNRHNPQRRAKAPFEFVYTDLVGPIKGNWF